MTIECVIGRIDSAVADCGEVDWIDIDWRQTVRRCLRLTSRAGRRINVLLPRDHPTLRDGDELAVVGGAARDGGAVRLALAVRPCPVLRLRPQTLEQMGTFCAEAGNQHWPLAIDGDSVIALDDGPTRELADRLAVPYRQAIAAFHPARFSVSIAVRDER